jgi:hypothetical protein
MLLEGEQMTDLTDLTKEMQIIRTEEMQVIRLRCLKLALGSLDTDGEVAVEDILRRAEILFAYVASGTVPEPVAEPPDADADQ